MYIIHLHLHYWAINLLKWTYIQMLTLEWYSRLIYLPILGKVLLQDPSIVNRSFNVELLGHSFVIIGSGSDITKSSTSMYGIWATTDLCYHCTAGYHFPMKGQVKILTSQTNVFLTLAVGLPLQCRGKGLANRR